MKNILITGGSTGIGLALAKHYAALGCRLFLLSRSMEKLTKAKQEVLAEGASLVEIFAVDVKSHQEIKEIITKIDVQFPLDVIYANAGISAGTEGGKEDEAQVKILIETNILGMINTLHAGIEVMKPRNKGNIAVISSVASFFPMPSCPSYSATKAFVRTYAESLAILYSNTTNIKITTICPGYVKTPMTAVNKFPMPFLMTAEKAAKLIVNAVEKGKLQFIFPLPMLVMIKLCGILGISLLSKILAKLPSKERLG